MENVNQEIVRQLEMLNTGMRLILNHMKDQEATNPKPSPKVRQQKNYTSQNLETARFILATIKRSVTIKDPNIASWANDVRLMEAVDKRSDDQIRDAITRFSHDPFWAVTCRSPASLRKHFDRSQVLEKSKGEDPNQYR
mgnify:FL=1